MAQAEWKKYFRIKDNTFYGVEANKDKLPKSAKEEILLKDSGIFCIFTDTGNSMIWDSIQQRWY